MNQSVLADIDTVLNKFNSDVERMIKDALNIPNSPATIFHYTNDVGMKGILESGRLWLTDVFSLNDPSELKHGFRKTIEAWKKKKAFYDWAEAEGIADFLEYLDEGAGFRETAHLFTCSFSADGDELGQWRAYADDGRGYALGFDRAALELAFIQGGSSPFAQTFNMQYDDAQLADLEDRILEKALPLIDLVTGMQPPTTQIEAAKRKVAVSLASNALYGATLFKHKAYRNEQEYRFLEMFPSNITPAGLKMRARRYSQVRYRELDWRAAASSALKKIILGPAANRHRGSQFAHDCLSLYHSGDVEVTQSPIPYRAL